MREIRKGSKPQPVCSHRLIQKGGVPFVKEFYSHAFDFG
jgi:hypothetical protein